MYVSELLVIFMCILSLVCLTCLYMYGFYIIFIFVFVCLVLLDIVFFFLFFSVHALPGFPMTSILLLVTCTPVSEA